MGGDLRDRGVRGAARGHERELKASVRHMKKHNAKLQIEYPRTATPEEVPKQTSIDRPL